MPKLTKKLVESSLPKEKDYIIWDDEIKGFGCRILPSGRRTYVFHYTSPATRKYSYLKIGVHGNCTVDQARDKAKKWCGDIVQDIDPKEQKKAKAIAQKKSILFADFWEIFTDKYIREHHKPSTMRANKSRIKNNILPFFGTKKISDIQLEDIVAFKDTFPHVRGNCSKCIELLSPAFEQAELWGYRDRHTNPCKGIAKSPSRKMERFLTAAELKKLEEVLASIASSSRSSQYTVAAIWLLIFTGCRLGEVLDLQWEGVHLEDGYLYLKDSKVGVRTIPLNDKAKQLFTPLQKQEGNPYVFCGKLSGKPLNNINKTWHKVRTLSGIPDVRIHDLRHSFASFALKQGIDLYTVSKLLGHKNISTTTRYAHLELDHLKKATNKVAGVFG
jgi:integrase